jgi:hypothetical protein
VVLVDGTAATVGKVLITVQDAYFFYALQSFRERGAPPSQFIEGDELKNAVQKMVLEEMVYAEMTSLQYEGGTRAEAENLLQQLKGKEQEGRFKETLARYGKTEAAAVDRLWKSLKVERFIQKKVETLTPIITEGEVERYYKQNQAQFPGEYEAQKPNIVLLLKKQRMQKGLEEWVRFLKQKYGVQSHLDS